MNLKEIKNRLAALDPFVKFVFRGVNDCLFEDGVPLTVQATPPTATWMLESGHVTSLILRYSESYKEVAAKDEKGLMANIKQKPEIAKEIMTEIAEKVLGSEEDKIKQVAVVVKLAKSYLISKAVFGWYADDSDKFNIVFTPTKEEADLVNKEEANKLAIWIEHLDDMELVGVASRMIDVMPDLDNIPNIPIKDDIITGDGKIVEGVVDSVPADRVANFPRNTRSIVVEDVRQ